jgi:uncharacterized 2Fe-2S/4Fe-4S cluster protein (DUF4445 family)
MADVRFQDEAVPAVVGDSLLEHALRTSRAFKGIASSCGGSGTCGEGVVSVVGGEGALGGPTREEDAVAGVADDRYGGSFRLACQATVTDASRDIEVVTCRRDLKILTRGSGRCRTALNPRVRRRHGRVSIGDTAVETSGGRLFGIALDVGTTTIVAELVDLESGETRATASFENPQRFGGSNVINRIGYDRDHRGLLQRVLVGHLNSTLRELPCGRDEILELVVAGNPTMRDLLFGLDVQPLGVSPFLSTTETEREAGTRGSTALDVAASDLGVEAHPNARVYGLPLVACHVGADAAAGMLVSGMWSADEPTLFMDIGTNTEVLLGNRDRVLAASSPAGPAFEGAGVTFGMPGMEGAIESVRLEDGSVRWRTIGGVPPRGICGSGLVDLLGELVRTGRINPSGRLRDPSGSMHVAAENGITFSDRDIAEIAQAKGSNYAAQMILMKLYGVDTDGIGGLHLAGGFAEYLDVAQAQRIGMIAPVPPERVVKLGNASLEGARALLCDVGLRPELERRVRSVEHVRLELDPDFFGLFVEGMRFQVAGGA